MSDKLFNESYLNEATNQGHATGKPSQIISIIDDKLTFNEENLERILLKTNKPILVISIVGSFRTGKSFILNSFIRYVKNNHKQSKDSQDYCISDGFDWSYGSDAHTKGIWLWDTPLNYNLKGQEVSLVFMDTQGIFDNGSSQKDCSIIFSLSAFMSSVQILNIRNNIEKRDLEYLSIFAQFKCISQKKLDNVLQYEQLTFLIRDWNFPDENSYGFQGGEKLLNDRLTSNCSSKAELNDLLGSIKKQFKKRNCFLMPYPGATISRKSFNGDSKFLTTDFNEYSKLFFKETINSLNIDKSRPNLFNNGRSLFNMLKDYVNVLKCDSMPDMESVTTIYYKHNNLMCCQMVHKAYNDEISKFLENQVAIVKTNELESIHKITMNKCLENFNIYKMGPETPSYDSSSITNEINKFYEKYRNIAKDRNEKEILRIQKRAINKYSKIMNEFCGDDTIYKPSLEIFLKHQYKKTECLREMENYRNWAYEIEISLSELNKKIDSILKTFDDKNALKRKNTIELIISKCINKYNEFMELKLKENESYIESEEFHESHLVASEMCIKEFEVLSKNYKDINNEFELIISKEISILQAKFNGINSERKSTLKNITSQVQGLIVPYLKSSTQKVGEATRVTNVAKRMFLNSIEINKQTVRRSLIVLGQYSALFILFTLSIFWGLIYNICLTVYERGSQELSGFLKNRQTFIKNTFNKRLRPFF